MALDETFIPNGVKCDSYSEKYYDNFIWKFYFNNTSELLKQLVYVLNKYFLH